MKIRRTTKYILKILQLLVIAAIFAAPFIGSAPVRPALAAPSYSSALSLGELLNPDGTINLNSGYRGSLDLKGWEMINDPRQGPRFAPLAAGDGHWDTIFGRPGVNSAVNALAVDGTGNLYVGGNFTTAGYAIANYIAMWDGSVWSQVGGGLNALVSSLVFGPDGYLYVAGNFQNAGGDPNADRIAVWNGTAWLPLGTGFANQVYAVAFDSSGNLYAAGAFTNGGLNRIAMWDGSTWTALGSGFSNGTVLSLAVDGNDDLYAGGSFTDAVGNMDYIAKWDGLAWSALGTGLSGQVNALAISGSTDVYVGGSFTDAGGNTSADRIALWNGGGWVALGSGIANNAVFALTMDGSNLLVGGSFTDAGGDASADRVAIWSGSAWSAVATGVDNTVRAFALTTGGFFAGGDLALAGDVVADRVVEWDGSSWLPVGSGNGFRSNSTIYALTLDGSGNLYAGGNFSYAGSVEASRVAKWDGLSWSVLGSGTSGPVNALLVDETGNLYAGGNFTTAGGWTVNNVAKWDGSDWIPLGSAPNVGVTGGQVNSLTMDASGNLYVGGAFTSAGGQPANRIAKWDGNAWSALGDGFDNAVNVLLEETGKVYAGGNFLNSGGNAIARLAVWDGNGWSAVGNGVNNSVFALLSDGSENLYVGGNFTDAGGVGAADRIALWNGNTWSALGTGTNGAVRDMALDGNGALIVVGEFQNAGVSAFRIARFYDGSWSAMGSGTNQPVYTLMLENDWSLFIGGSFTTAGDKGQAYMAHWFNTVPVAVADSYSTPEEQVLVVAAPGVIENDYDDNGDTFQASVIVPPSVGTLTLNADDGSFVYTPTLDYDEAVNFTYEIMDEYGGTASAEVTITMEPINDAPVAVDDYAITFEGISVSVPVLANDFDVDEDVLFVDWITGPLHGSATISGTTEVLYDPDPGYIGTDWLFYVVSDGVLTDTGKINITIDETNDPPVAQDDNYTVNEDQTLDVSAPGVLSNDTDQEELPLSAILVSDPANGVLTLNSDGSFTYVPDANYNGTDSFTYKANDGYNDSNVATVNITITPVNDPPVAVDDSFYVVFNRSRTFPAPGVLANDTDLEGDALIATLVGSPSHGTVTLYGDGSFTYTPDDYYLGTDTFTYSVSDGHGGTATGTVTIYVVEYLPSQFMYIPLVDKH